MNRQHKCILLICLITHSVLPTGQAITVEELKEHNEKVAKKKSETPNNAAEKKEDSLTKKQQKIMEAHPSFSNFYALPPDYYEQFPQTDPPEQPTTIPNKYWKRMQEACDYYGILHFKEDISLAPMPLKTPVFIDEEISNEYECEFSEAAKQLLRHKGVLWFLFRRLYATSPYYARLYLKGFGIDIKGPLFPEISPSSRKSTSKANSLPSRSARSLNGFISKITKSPSSRGQNTFSGSSMSGMKNRMSRSGTLKSISNLVKKVNPSKWSVLRNQRVGLAQTLKKADQGRNQNGTP